tara:strand:+ start:494 stop:1534 length:1041 start_codon:yes stop_codon:yes gene_type:complete
MAEETEGKGEIDRVSYELLKRDEPSSSSTNVSLERGDEDSNVQSTVGMFSIEDVNHVTAHSWQDILLHQAKKINVVIASLTLLFLILLVALLLKVSDMQTEIDAMEIQSSKLHFTSTEDGKTSLDVIADEIRFPNPKTWTLKEDIEAGKRVWSIDYLIVHVGDVVQWTWSSNENVVSCDESGSILLDQQLYSGPLTLNGKYTKRFLEEGIFYFTSQNSQTLTAKIRVKAQPFIAPKNDYTGPAQPMPSGIQKAFSFDDLHKVNGCWELCAEKLVSASTSSTLLNECVGDYIFFGLGVTGSGVYDIGAFAKADIFSRASRSYSGSNSCVNPITIYENGLHWYEGYFR